MNKHSLQSDSYRMLVCHWLRQCVHGSQRESKHWQSQWHPLNYDGDHTGNRSFAVTLLFWAVVLGTAASANAQSPSEIPEADPASVGMSADRLDVIDEIVALGIRRGDEGITIG